MELNDYVKFLDILVKGEQLEKAEFAFNIIDKD